ncbi:MAG: SIMPL domain-containing protein [Alphaproteobacteria bacterium]|nr:SIMPL domain-containing protein [Alphaproteobacteria bacterium]
MFLTEVWRTAFDDAVFIEEIFHGLGPTFQGFGGRYRDRRTRAGRGLGRGRVSGWQGRSDVPLGRPLRHGQGRGRDGDEGGFKDDEIALQRVEIQDTLAQGYRNDVNKNARFILTQNVLVRSNDIEQVRKVSREIGELARRGVVLNDTPGPNFIVTAQKLNEIKPGLIRQATERAKVAADEFAQTSGSKVGGIRRANQGVIVLLARDESPFEGEYQAVDKRIRAVTTVDYFLAKN